jgi:NAD(P)H-hydrate epimerase
MKILSAEQVRAWDQYTILHEPITSLDLMERAAAKCVEWILAHHPGASQFSVFCGKGNNGGDGLAISRMLMNNGFTVAVYILEFGHLGTTDFQENLARLHAVPGNDIHFIQTAENFHPFSGNEIVIDALFGSGLNRGLDGMTAALVNHINASGRPVIAIDIPSGLFVDHSSLGQTAVKATHTLAFQCYKPVFLHAENESFIGQLHILDIGLHTGFYEEVETAAELTDPELIRSLYKPRKDFSHKGNFGHALLLAGSTGKMGAAVLAAKAVMKAGAGLLTVHLPSGGLSVIQTAFPEAMAEPDIHEEMITRLGNNLAKFDSIGIGPGIGTSSETSLFLKNLLNQATIPLVIDADALNCVAADPSMLAMIPPGSILTPHPKEFERLFGQSNNDFDRVSLAIDKSIEYNCIIILKGHHTCITGAGKIYFNSTGNPGMATAGSGDVLTGMITGLFAQGYSSLEAALLAVYLHGLAGDLAAAQLSMESMTAGDLLNFIGKAFLAVSTS